MAWTNSKIFTAFPTDVFEDTAAFDLGATGVDVIKAALYNNTITPDQTVAAASTAYNAGQWATAQEVFEAGQWAQAGVALTSPDISNPTTTSIRFDSADPQSGTAADLTNATGVLIYDDDLTTPVADQGICYNYLGGPQSVSNGTFTVIVHANGWLQFTV